MAISFELPQNIEMTLRQQLGNLDQAAKEALLIETYRGGRLTHRELSEALGLDRFETEALLKKYHVTEDLPTLEDLERDRQTLEQLLGPAR